MACPNDRPVLLQGVVFKDEGRWIARCFTFDHTAQGDTPEKALANCIETLIIDIQFAVEHKSMAHLKPVPSEEVLAYFSHMTAQRPLCPEITVPFRADRPTRGVAAFSRARKLAFA